MKFVAFLLTTLGLAVIGCKSPTSPTTPAQAPATGSIFTFHTVGTANGTPVSFDMAYTIQPTTDGFKAVDSNGAETNYKLYENGDIGWSCSCDWLELGVASHGQYKAASSRTPMKLDGREFNASIHFESKYLGQEPIAVQGKTYDCAKVEVDVVGQTDEKPAKNFRDNAATYWYSPALRYFTRIDTRTYYLDSLVSSSTMTLVGVK